ncbi:MAG: hypothetical protein AB1778_02800 [Candidatus Bipolaricaulota bacterium]
MAKVLVGLGVVAAAVVLVLGALGGPSKAIAGLTDEIRNEIIPVEGTETSYGIPLSLTSLPQFIAWWTTKVPQVENEADYGWALGSLVAPCCDDNPVFHCCCEGGPGQACNLIRSAKGLAAHLFLDLEYSADEVRESVYEWLRFARPDYYVAAELATRGENPAAYGLTTQGSCYRGLCNTPISQGGCGGMNADEILEPTLTDQDA